MNSDLEFAIKQHEHVPPDWYHRSIKNNLVQKYVHTRRFKEVGKLIEEVEGKVLDIGCADGTFSQVILSKSKAKKLIGIDVIEGFVDWAKNHWRRNKKLEFTFGDAENLKFKGGTFDAVFVLEVLEHVAKPKRVLKEARRVLKKGGYGVFLVPTESLLFKAVWFFWSRIKGKVWKHTHIKNFRKNLLTRLCRQANFEIEEDRKIIFKTLHLVKVRKI